ncbi:cytoplasmic dynein 2 heavy chain 1 [Melanerpes formicivorus]|uniref:cytoplasmic dynein 2 heavy chain 1 n=1 Tax=Melanerpes formicivorus TaxID=211600 RepID=UPI00358F7E6C
MAGEGDKRKRFISATAANFFGLDPAVGSAALAAGLHSRPELTNFLDDGNEFLLVVQYSGTQLTASNKIEATDSENNVLVFFKLRPDVITEENLHSNILVSSMLDSPINTLYQAVRQVFAPVLLKDERWSKTFDPKLQKLLSELEAGLSTVLRRSDPNYTGTLSSEDDVRAILTPTDEFQFWIECAHHGSKWCSKERASYFKDLFEDIAKDYYNLDSLSLLEVVDLVEATKDTVDGVWRQTEHDPYPQPRMHNLLDVIGGSLGRYVQRKLSALNLWEDSFHNVKENVKAGILICEQWVSACEYLTGQLWQRYALHPWKNEKHFPESLARLGKRLDEVLTVRTLHEKLTFFLPSGEQNASQLAHVFEPFAGLNPIHCNPYTEPLWKAAVSQYEKIIAPAEKKIASKLKKCIVEIQDSPQQLLQTFQKYKELIKHPNISKELLFERETLLARLQDYVKDHQTDFETRCHGVPGDVSGPLSGKNLSEVVNNIVWVRQLELKVDDAIKLAEALLSDLAGFQTFHRSADSFLEQLKAYEQEQFDDWSRNIQAELSNPKSGLCIQANSPVMELDHKSGALNILYSDRLVTLLREVRQLSALGFAIPAKIQRLADTAQKFCKQAVILKQVAHFYNSIDQQMIESQKPMMLQSALAFEQIIKHSRSGPGGKGQITWDNPRELEAYIQKLQAAAERLSTENRKLRKLHRNFIEKVISLMNIDLLRQQQRWKDGLQELRTGFASLESQGFKSSDMKAWRQHWNHQLYKALEHQYQMGLEALNENLPEINIDLIFKQSRLQFRPPFEEVRARYYREMKRFISIPNQFRGVSEAEDSIFTVMTERNASGFLTAFSKAEDLFRRLSDVTHQFKEWVVIGQIDVETLVKTHLSSKQDWEKNFKALKVRGKEAERLPSTIRIDCLTVNCNPVKTVIDDFIQKLYDVLVSSLRKSIQAHLSDVSSFLADAMETLVIRPQTVEEIAESNVKYMNLHERKEGIFLLFQEAEDKNKLLRTVAGAGLDTISNLRATWDKFELMMESHQLMIAEQIEVMKGNVISRVNIYLEDLEKFKAHWDQLKPSDDVIEAGDQNVLEKSAEIIKEKKKEFDELEAMKERLIEECHHFKLEEPDFSLSKVVCEDLKSCAEVWALYEDFYQGFEEKAKEDWITFRSKTYLFEEFLFNWHDKMRKMEEHTVMTVKLQKEVDKYRMIIPLLKYVRGEHLSPDHWLDLFRLLGLPRGTTLEGLLFGDLLKVSDAIIEKATELKDLNCRAQGEITIREALRELELWAVGAVFTLTDYEDSQGKTIRLIKDWKDIVNQVGEHRCLLQSLKDSPYYKGFEDKVSIWEKKLADLDEYLQNLNQIQRKWVYLEPIFGRGALPKEHARFNRVDEDFRSIMSDIKSDNRITSLNARTGIRNTLITILDQLQRCQRSLMEYLEEKRSAFPRFYFIGDDDLLEILGQSMNPLVIQSHLKKLFAGINSVSFDEEFKYIVAMKSVVGETVPLRNKVLLSNDVEVWLNNLALEMKETLKKMLIDCVDAGKKSQGSVDPSFFPSQILSLAEQIQFTEDVENAIQDHKLQQLESQLVTKLEHYTSIDTSIGDTRNTESGVLELKLKALILDIIHNIDIVKQLNQAQVHSVEDWAWKKQLRFYMKDQKCYIQMVDAELQYTYEYQGNSPKLVYTPLTDKCYLTLTQAMKMGLGGNPYGPAGTGKTESVKALGGLLGRQVLVFNCDEGIDVKSMGRIFVGLVKCGAWGCFDEFNRLEEAVLSAVSMQIQTIQHALKKHSPVCEMLGKKVEMDHNSGIFITLNPAGKGYGGRQKLPDNLKQLFRPVAMTHPDNELIAEVILYSEGFKEAKILGRKLVAIFNLARELLTPQQHYDWGLRALKTVLRGCGSLLHQMKKSEAKQEINESHMVVQALRLNTMSKLTFADCARFDALVKDVFPGIDFKDVEYAELTTALQQVFEEANLEIISSQIKKALELYEQLCQRMGVVIVGPSGGGKSTLWRMLKAALGKTGKVVKQYTMNPKAMPRHRFLGHIDMDTREWSDGVLTNSARQVVREPRDITSWIICDGDIDPEWIESLNSVLDDNRLLTMPSGERIQFGSNVNFIFETHDLSCASPATISRMGMIFLSDEDTDLNSLIKSWLRSQPEECRYNLENWIGDYFEKALNWVVKKNDSVVETSLVGTVMNGLSHLRGCTDRGQFIINLLRGLGGNLNMKSRQEFAREIFSWAQESPPDPRKPLDTYYDVDTGQLMLYQLKKPENLTADDFSNLQTLPVIQTPDMQRGLDYFRPWLDFDNKQPFLLVGPEGCGKGMLLHYAFSQLRSTQIATVHCSAQTTSQHLLQKLSQTCIVISTNTGRVYRPKDCERLVLYLKDINLPKPDKWGTSTLVAFLQQILTYQGFYDENLEWVGLENIQIVASMSAGGTLGRHKLTSRFTSIVRLCAIDYPERDQLQNIYSAYLEPVLQKNLKNHPVWGSSAKIYQLAGSMVQVYEQVRAKFTVDDHSHYLFTPCILTQWVLGLFRYDLAAGSSTQTADYVLEIVAYEAHRLFRDKIVGMKELHVFDNILMKVFQDDLGSDVLDNIADTFYVTWGACQEAFITSGQALPPHGRPLGRLNSTDLKDVIQKGIIHYGRDKKELEILLFQEVLSYMSKVDRVLSFPGGSLLLAGRSGVGRRTVTSLVSHMHGAVLVTPKISRGYELKQFKNDIKYVMELAGIEAQQVVLLLEDYQFVHSMFLEMINSLLSSGEVPGLYKIEELEPLLSPLKDQASQDGFTGPIFNYFTYPSGNVFFYLSDLRVYKIMKEWETFTGVIIGDTIRKSDSQRSARDQIPSWIEQDRAWAVASLKISLPGLYQTLCFEDEGLWHTFSRSSVCEQDFPSTIVKRISLFQQVLVVQAVRPDRLQSAMTLFACKTLGIKELSPLPLNLKRLYKETLEIEPILIIISPGADPSQELQELANVERNAECYHQIAMGQGQADLAIQTLKECARNGEWLCLKNLHLVTSWLPVLEKELNTLQPQPNFRLWLTTEVHPKFTPILLQSSLKITYEAPPGLKKNLLRTYESWTPEQISKKGNLSRAHSLFCLAWFHAVCQERRNYIPQGWTKFYEFSLSDLRAGFDIIDRLFDGSRDIQWEFVHGLFENAIYGGRVDNYFDMRVLRSYLEQLFNSRVIGGLNPRGKKITHFPCSMPLPNSCSILDYRNIIESLPEDDKPDFFGLPANIARSSQRIFSSQVISQLRILSRSVTAGCKFDREIWSTELSPVLNLWKKLNQSSNLIHQKVSPPVEQQGSPILSFIMLEQFNAIRLVQSIHQSLASLSKVIRGTSLLSSEVQRLASALLNQKCPITWQSKWEGPEDPLQYLRSLVARALAIQNWVEKAEKQKLLSDTLDLSELFHPDTFLNALRQETARIMSCSVDGLKFTASWKGQIQGGKLQVKISGLQLEGCSFDGNRLAENLHDSPSVSALLPCYMAWIPQDAYGPYSPEECISLPVYTSVERDRVVINIDVPCGENKDQWIQCGAALFLTNQ